MVVFAFGLFSTSTYAQEKSSMTKKHMHEKKDMMKKDMMKKDMMNDNVTVIELKQVEGKFTTENLNLKPGKYQFRVVNDGVQKDLGFLIQAKKDAAADPMKTALENSMTTSLIKNGSAQYTGVVTLGAGEYVYSCPLNPTPKYSITVK